MNPETDVHRSRQPDVAGESGIPLIPRMPDSFDRPLLSVMIPTWRPHAEHLERAIRGVLVQIDRLPGTQVEIVDDCSPDFDPYAFAGQFGSPALSVYRHEHHVGLADNWNACLIRARGRWVHVLHQDDLVLD